MMPRFPLSRTEKRLTFTVPLALLLIMGGVVVYNCIFGAATINFPAPVLLPRPNGYDVYIAAAKAIVLANPPVDAVDDSSNLLRTNPKLAGQNYSLGRKAAWLKSNATGFALFRQAQKLPCRSPASSLVVAGKGSYMRKLGRCKVIEAHTFALRGDWNGEVTSALDILQLGNDIAQDAPVMGKLVGGAIEELGHNLLATDKAINALNTAQSRAATRRLEAILKRRPTYAQALENERWDEIRMFDQVRHSPHWRGDLFADSNSSLSLRDKWGQFIVPEKQIVAEINRQFDQEITNVKKPFLTPITPAPLPRDPISRLFFYPYNCRVIEGLQSVPIRVLLLRLALRAYKAERGRFPTRLSQLSPRYLQKIPTDYYADDAPFHYAVKGDNYLLYSIGPDGKDDGGTPIQCRSKNRYGESLPPLRRDGKGDYVAGKNR